MHGDDTAERSSLCDQGPIWALTGQAVTTASRDAGAQVRIIYVNACLMTLGAARDVHVMKARVGL